MGANIFTCITRVLMNAATPVSAVHFIYITTVHYFYHDVTSPFGQRPHY